MDWSLVLASQGIDAAIERDPETNHWLLRVDATDYPRAIQAIRQYLRENRSRKWCQELPLPGLVLDWRGGLLMLFFVLIYAADAFGRFPLRTPGLMSNQAVWNGEWWRLFTAITLHADLPHLTGNVTIGLLLVGLAMGAFGPGLGLLAPLLAGVIGNLAGAAFYGPNHQGLGASGLVLGALGLVTAQSLLLFRQGSAPRHLVIRAILGGCLLLILFGLNPQHNTDLLAHGVGCVVGFGSGAVLSWRPHWILGGRGRIHPVQLPPKKHLGIQSWIDRTALTVVLLAFGLPWSLALHNSALLLAAAAGCLAVWVYPRRRGANRSPAPKPTALRILR